jgi:sugar/nucleoside kinase (ribokinase family)
MTPSAFHVVAVGNAIVDILQPVEEGFLTAHDIAKGGMTLIDDHRALYLTGLFEDAVIAAGGSAANTVTGIASFGGKAGYIGKVADDDLGADFTAAFRGAGVSFETGPFKGPPGTARCLIAVTPDGQRSMNTYLGASTLLEAADIDKPLIESAQILFLEGYLFDREEAKAAFVHASEIARAAGRKVSVTLSDTFCVERHRASFRHLVKNHVDILFANEAEIIALYQAASFDEAMVAARADAPIVAVTRSDKGSVVATPHLAHDIAAEPVARVADTTGAGDLYAAGFLFGLATGRALPECGRLGSIAAAEVISHMGPRPETSLKQLAAAAGL